MILFGTKKKEIKSGRISNIVCHYCSENVTMNYSVETSYFHLYWIPIFPYKKRTYADCTECDTLFEYKHFSEQLKNKLNRENELKPSKNPVWMYSGLLILGVIIPLAFFQSSRADSKKDNYVNNPKVGDVYYLNSLPSKYTTMKIAAVEKDSVHFILNDTSVTKFVKVFSINEDHYYSTKNKSYSKSQLTKLLENDSIYSIDRKK